MVSLQLASIQLGKPYNVSPHNFPLMNTVKIMPALHSSKIVILIAILVLYNLEMIVQT